MRKPSVGLIALFTALAATAAGALISPQQAQAASTAYVWVINGKSNRCAVPSGASSDSGIVQYSCSSSTWHTWRRHKYYTPSRGTYYKFQNHYSGKCLTASTVKGGQAWQTSCGNFDQQRFKMRRTSTGYYKLRTLWGNRHCLAVQGGSTAAGAKVITWPCGLWEDHYWRFRSRA